jgi:serine phosphatase RsbU (regulator of sigma subunit)
MALIRSLIRAFAGRNLLQVGTSENLVDGDREFTTAGTELPPNSQLLSLITDLTALNTVLLTNNYLVTTHEQTNMFATLFLGVLDQKTGQVTYLNAGHNPPYVVSAGKIKARLKASGPAVGMFAGANFLIQQTQLDPGDCLYTFTDGVTEARALDGEFFQEKRLQVLLEEPIESPQSLLERIEEHLSEHTSGAEPNDDITMLAVWRKPV